MGTGFQIQNGILCDIFWYETLHYACMWQYYLEVSIYGMHAGLLILITWLMMAANQLNSPSSFSLQV